MTRTTRRGVPEKLMARSLSTAAPRGVASIISSAGIVFLGFVCLFSAYRITVLESSLGQTANTPVPSCDAGSRESSLGSAESDPNVGSDHGTDRDATSYAMAVGTGGLLTLFGLVWYFTQIKRFGDMCKALQGSGDLPSFGEYLFYRLDCWFRRASSRPHVLFALFFSLCSSKPASHRSSVFCTHPTTLPLVSSRGRAPLVSNLTLSLTTDVSNPVS